MLTLSFLALSCAVLTARCDARHMHRFHMHHEHRRQVPSVTVTSENVPSTTEFASPSITAGDAAIENIQQIRNGLSDLPANLLSFVQAVEARLEDMESMLLQMMSSTSAEQTTTSTPAASTPASLESPTTIPTSTDSSPAFYSSPSSSLAAVVPVVPVESAWNTTTHTSRVTTTRIRTLTVPEPTATSTASEASRGLPSGSITNSGNWTMPYTSSRGSAVSTLLTRTARSVMSTAVPTAVER